MIEEARVLFADYNRWRLQTSSIEKKRSEGVFVRTFKETPERLALFQKLALWCRDRGLDPRLWVYLLFRSRAWTFPPPLLENHFLSERMVPKYHKMADRALDGYRRHLRDYYGKNTPFDPNWEISAYSEAMKERYASYGDQDRCVRETVDNTLGFHPKSPVCVVCPARSICLQQLRQLIPEFDILALREGRISPETAKLAVLNARRSV